MCGEVQDSTHSKLMSAIQDPQNVREVLLPNSQEAQMMFIERIRFLMGQHDLVEEMDKLEERSTQ
jgi:hypothetical protein